MVKVNVVQHFLHPTKELMGASNVRCAHTWWAEDQTEACRWFEQAYIFTSVSMSILNLISIHSVVKRKT